LLVETIKIINMISEVIKSKRKTVLIKKSDLLKWYKSGEKYNVVDEPVNIGGKYKYIYDENHIIDMEDCYTDNEIRERKLERIVYYEN